MNRAGMEQSEEDTCLTGEEDASYLHVMGRVRNQPTLSKGDVVVLFQPLPSWNRAAMEQ